MGIVFGFVGYRIVLTIVMFMCVAKSFRPRVSSCLSLAGLSMCQAHEAKETSAPKSSSEGSSGLRLEVLRRAMKGKVDAFIVPTDDPHLSEYTSPYYQRRSFISGFTGSAGTAVITKDKALLFTDGRYHNQASHELDGHWELMKSGLKGVPSVNEWLKANLQAGSVVGIDPTVHSAENVKGAKEQLRLSDIDVNYFESNPIDEIWNDMATRPDCPTTDVRAQDIQYAGRSVKEKLREIRERLREKSISALVVSALDEIAYLFNIRGADIPCNPVTIAYAMVTDDAAYLFADEGKFNSVAVKEHLGEAGVDIYPYEDAMSTIAKHSHLGKVWIDGKSNNFALYNCVANTSSVHDESSPVTLMKACKNLAELEAMRECHLRDGAAMAEFFADLEESLDPNSEFANAISEVDIDRMVCHYRTKIAQMLEPSFPTIAGVGENGAIIHYCADSSNCKIVEPSHSDGAMVLLDSGGQYIGGTTDVTRTFHTGIPTGYQKEMFTRVLKGNIGLDTQIFPAGTPGCLLDSFAREHLWKGGKDYLHGTGHGVGAALNVHEGPQRISRVLDKQPLMEGMVVSNEPGYYEDGNFGIRIENLLTVINKSETFSGRAFLGFEKLTMIPIQHKCMDFELLTPKEIEWIDRYHAEIRRKVKPFLETERAERWLNRSTVSCAEFLNTAP